MLCSFQPKNDLIENIFEALKNNQSKSIVKYFGSSVNLSLNGEERMSTKFQSELLLDQFFKEYPINSIKVVSSGGNQQSNSYIVYAIKAPKDSFQVVVKFMEIKGESSIFEFKIY